MADSFPAVLTFPSENGQPTWKVQNVTLARSIGDTELQVRMVATGICHSDITISTLAAGSRMAIYPRVLGHEGAGIVEAVGKRVKSVNPGDFVLLSLTYCNDCGPCKENAQTKCENLSQLNTMNKDDTFQSREGGFITGKFFGQSSFAAISIVDENCSFNVTGLVTRDDLKILAPLGCGLRTGVGALINAGRARPKQGVIVTGVGGVGLGAIMAAKIIGCSPIIAIDRVSSRLEIAKSLGASHVVNTVECTDLVEAVKKLDGANRVTAVVETTGIPSILRDCINCLAKHGILVHVGISPLESSITLPIGEMFWQHITYTTSTLGDGEKIKDMSRMLEWWKSGQFPLEKFVKFFDAKCQVQDALDGMMGGEVIKPILIW